MTASDVKDKLGEKGFNLNSMLTILTILGMVITGTLWIAPLRTLPDTVEKIKEDQKISNQVQQNIVTTQAVQTSALNTLATVAGETKQMRRDVDQNSSGLINLQQRIIRIEKKP